MAHNCGDENNVDIERPCVLDAKFDFFGHEMVVGVIGLGLVAGGGYFTMRYHHRATNKFFNTLCAQSEIKLSKINSVLPRGQMTVGIRKEPFKELNLSDAYRSVALVGDNRSGKTTFLSHSILNVMFPLWYRCIFPPRGLFLTGSKHSPTIDSWLKGQIPPTEKDDPWSALADLLSQRRNEQRVRLFLHMVFKTSLPSFLRPQPVIIIVDQAEELLRMYRADFLFKFDNLVKKARDEDLFRLVFVINSDNAVKALNLMSGGDMFDFIQAPRVSREAVVSEYSEEFAKIFDDRDGNIGIALEYRADKGRSKETSPKEYAATRNMIYIGDHCLLEGITVEEYNRKYSWK